MKKKSIKQRNRDVLLGIAHRQGKFSRKTRKNNLLAITVGNLGASDLEQWLTKHLHAGDLNIEIGKYKEITLHLPEIMNFSTHYEQTVIHLSAIRKLVSTQDTLYAPKLRLVRFDQLKSISTSASIALTAELSRWDDHINHGLRPRLETWDKSIITQLNEFGFFKLFAIDTIPPKFLLSDSSTNIRYVPYIKGKKGEKHHRATLKTEIEKVAGDEIEKWLILSSGLSEAITNVSHHAYPADFDCADQDKCWYMGGSFDKRDSTLRVVFFDQGIGIPKSLPTSKIWENILDLMSQLSIPYAEQKKDAVLLKAAVEYERTSTNKEDRGKGLQDLLNFIRERGDGYLSILSQKGLFKYSLESGTESTKSESFSNPLQGTLIIWKVQLTNTQDQRP